MFLLMESNNLRAVVLSSLGVQLWAVAFCIHLYRLRAVVLSSLGVQLWAVDWRVGTGEGNGVRSLTAFYPEEASNSNVSILITGLGADFTSLESFGKVDAFAESLVGGLDRSWQRPPGVAAKLIDSKATNGLYYLEYTLKNPGESRRHLLSVLGMANNGFYNRLYTLTGQVCLLQP
ncbi:psbP domain-containing protein 3, chloroplastic [Dorcoceras hygrometricum]|uniref:PsbP domain-containing protein 3, chloroplastic n=1 Tax=Dorcoceras hygrometricum TaxID=472368 RepID=A0A2Z7CZA1_9LAMI|nr:psbP domain-containing protein 3, chloroplastic [Dorcoceras hygrometricum]